MLGALTPYVEYAAAATSLCFLLSPLVEVQKVHRSKGEALGDVNPVNLLLMLLNSALWLWYAIFLPVPPAVLCNTIGLAACCYYLASCWFYARQRQEKMWGTAAAFSTILAFMTICLALAYASSSSAHVEQVGYMAVAVNILAYGAPLSVMSQVIVEQCSGPLPPVQCALALSCSFLWLCVGLDRQSMPMIIPNACGVPLAILQLFLLWRYPRTRPAGKDLIATSTAKLRRSLRYGRHGSRAGGYSQFWRSARKLSKPLASTMLVVGISTDSESSCADKTDCTRFV
ncbi:SWEET7B [Symbiodinium pilosum]|uniref:SWEET7B protein n=1 Tax=Symbiodinium pilosum TaxID=2952 RepID=A0A812LA02_SYMPI|nr:SWEET7B [Symbiodinium pilosum]